MYSSTPRRRSRVVAVAVFLVAVALIGIAVIGLAQEARAAQVSLKFDNGRMTLGPLLRNQTILPASDKFPSDSLPAPQRTDIELNGSLEGSDLEFPAALNTGIQFPYMHMMHPLEPGLRIPFTFRLKEPGLSGTFDQSTGQSTLAGRIDLVVVTGTGTSFPLPDGLTDAAVPPLGLFARCRYTDVPVEFSTREDALYPGEPFRGGFGAEGALSTDWSSMAEPVSENGGECGQLASITSGVGAIWLSNGIAAPKPSNRQGCDGNTFCRLPGEDDEEPVAPRIARVAGLKLLPQRRTARPGTKFIARVRLSNRGTAGARAVVRLRSNNRHVRIRSRIVVRVGAGRTVVRRVGVRVLRRARGKVRLVAATRGMTSRSTVIIRRR